MTRRPGLSLVEVLTALFILALGVIAIMTMFPLGASQMAIAVREDRSALAAFGADQYFRTYWKTQVVEPLMQQPPGTPDPFYNVLNTPGGGLPALNGTETLPSYPVAVDPMGFLAPRPNSTNPSANPSWLGD